MKQWFAETFETFSQLVTNSVLGEIKLWPASLSFFVVIGAFFWFFSVRRDERFSIKAVLGYGFPRDYYVDPTARVSHWHFALQVLLWGPLLALTALSALILSESVRGFLVHQFGEQPALLHSSWSIAVVQAGVIFLAGDLGQYVAHYSMHKVPFLWSFHRGHHSVEAMTLPALTREHPAADAYQKAINALFSGLACGVVMFATGTTLMAATVATLLGYLVWLHTLGIFNHSHVPVSYGWLNRIIQAPVMHQIHHSAELRHRDTNLGGILMIWDWMFGTLYIPKKGEEYRFGLNDDELGANNPHLTVREFYLEPFRHAWDLVRDRQQRQSAPACTPERTLRPRRQVRP